MEKTRGLPSIKGEGKMDFQLTDEQIQLQKAIRNFASKEIRPGAFERDQTGKWDQELWLKCGNIGLFGMPFPEEYGGSGYDALTTAIGLEGLGLGAYDSGLAMSISAHMVICGIPIWKHGTEAQKQKYLPKIITGEYIGAFGLTEPNIGSDAANIQTKARKEGNEYVLNGAKMFITNGSICDVLVVIAQLTTGEGFKGATAFLVEKGSHGFKAMRELDKMGNRSSPTAELVFEDCRIPAENLLGEEGKGFDIATDTLIWERALMLSHKLGAIQNLIDESLMYAKQREQFGNPIAEYQLIREKLAEMRMNLEAARWQAYHVAWMKDQGIDMKFEASMLKLFITETHVKAADHAVQIHGGYGYMKEYPVERMYRDAKLGTIGGGTSEIQKMIISSYLIKGKR
jgi:alkylation response protein AidB-like acyl-CoA dehydrogenase